MHLLSTQPGRFVEDETIITRLNQTPADVVVLSSADTTLALLSAACQHLNAGGQDSNFPAVRLVNLLHLRQNASLDLYIDELLRHAKVVVIDHLGAASNWSYGIETLTQLARTQGQHLVMFSGDQQEDPDLLNRSTLPVAQARLLWQYLRAGGMANAEGFMRALLHLTLQPSSLPNPPRTYPPAAVHVPLRWAQGNHPGMHGDVGHLENSRWRDGQAVVLLVFYRSHLLAGNTLAFDALAEALLEQGLNPLPLAVDSLKDAVCLQVLRALCDRHGVSLIINTTAFSALGEAGTGEDALAGDIPVLQAITCGNAESDWEGDPQGLRPRDIAMQVVLPEIDGRIISRAISFKGLAYHCEHTQVDVLGYVPQPDRVAFVAKLAANWCRLRALPARDKRVALILANYPGSEGRIGAGVGLDTPASVLQLLRQLETDGFSMGDPTMWPSTSDELMQLLTEGIANDMRNWPLRPAFQSHALRDYRKQFAKLPAQLRLRITEQWGEPEQDPAVRKDRFMIAGLRLGHVFIGIQPSRTLAKTAQGIGVSDYASYHDAELPPPHHYLAFYFWLRDVFGMHAVVHVGKHGNLEWLPGKSLALSHACWPDAILGPTPNIYPFIVNDPGEGAQAKRRTQAVIIDHLMPPLTRAETHGPMQDLERLVDEYYDALLVDQRRARILRQHIVDAVRAVGLDQDLGTNAQAAAQHVAVDTSTAASNPTLAANASEGNDDALIAKIDAYLCELKETQIRDGLHIFGLSPAGEQRRTTLSALARFPVGDAHGPRMGLLNALAQDLLPQTPFNPLDMEASAPWPGELPQALQELSASPWRTQGDTRERLELMALHLMDSPSTAASWPYTTAVLQRVLTEIAPALDACGPQEMQQFSRALQGKFVPPGPSGSPSRGRPDVLPTGRNFYTIDTRAIPSPTAWHLGMQSADRLIALYLQTHGEYPRELGLSVWGTATMRTGGDDIAQAFALIGVRPRWASGSQRVTDFEVIPRVGLHRPRVDVTLRVSGFFRDAFPAVMQMFDAAVQAVAEQEEDKFDNPIRARILHETAALQAQGFSQADARQRSGWRVFSSAPGQYGTGLHHLLQSGQWEGDADLARTFLQTGAYAYGQHVHGVAAESELKRRLSQLQIVLQNQDSHEHDVLDSSEYSQFQGGMTAAARHFGGRQPEVYHGDHGNMASARIRPLSEEISRVIHARVTNPRWIAGAMRHGYKGAFEMAATVDYVFAFDATAQVVGNHHYEAMTQAYLFNPEVRDFIDAHNPQALLDMHQRLLEAISRGLWQAKEETKALLREQALQITHAQEVRQM